MFIFKRTKKETKPNKEISLPETELLSIAAEPTDQELDKLGKELELSILYKKRDNIAKDVNMANLYYNYLTQIMQGNIVGHVFDNSDPYHYVSISLEPTPGPFDVYKGAKITYPYSDIVIMLSNTPTAIEISFYTKSEMGAISSQPKIYCRYDGSAETIKEIVDKIKNYLNSIGSASVGSDIVLDVSKDTVFIKYLFYIIESGFTKYLKELTDQLEVLNKELETQVVNM